MIHRIYNINRITRCRVTRKGVRYWDWLDCWAAGFCEYSGGGAW